MKIAVLGGGIAGTSAAWEARRGGAAVVLYRARPGATALYAGALDVDPAEGRAGDADLSTELITFGAALSCWSLGSSACQVVTHAGVVRAARGVDVGLLDLDSVRGRRIGVPVAATNVWDGRALVRAVSGSEWARQTSTEVVPVEVAVVDSDTERRLGDFDLCCLHDQPERAAALCAALGSTDAKVDAWLVGPWLGTRPESVVAIRDRLGVPIGETTCAPGGPCGARFEVARDDLLGATGVRQVAAPVEEIERHDGSWQVRHGDDRDDFDAVIVACGGVLAGGIAIDSGVTEAAIAGFRPGLSAPGVACSLDGRVLDGVSSLHGVDLQAVGLDALERVGLAVEGAAVRGAPALYAAGDVVAGRPRTALEAAQSGIDAARSATPAR